jgi:LysR family glycine cleavage system transcriptional activator
MLARANGDLATLLSSNRRIQSASWNEWRAWSEAAGLPLSAVTPTFAMEEFSVALAGALAGAGLALSPDVLVKDRLARGELVQFSPVTVKTGYAYHVCHAPNALRRPIIRNVINWLREEAGMPA